MFDFLKHWLFTIYRGQILSVDILFNEENRPIAEACLSMYHIEDVNITLTAATTISFDGGSEYPIELNKLIFVEELSGTIFHKPSFQTYTMVFD